MFDRREQVGTGQGRTAYVQLFYTISSALFKKQVFVWVLYEGEGDVEGSQVTTVIKERRDGYVRELELAEFEFPYVG